VSEYEIHRLDDFEAIPVSGADVNWRPIRRTLGIRAFGINAYSADEPGQHVVEEHTESALGHEEVYVVVRGRARFTLGEEEVEAGEGTLVYLRDPATKRAAVALEAGTTVLAVGGKPGEAYEPSAWEWFFAASPYRDRGDYLGGLAIMRDGLEQKPRSAALHYNVSCYEALAGNREAALEHLRRAVEIDDRARGWARGDEDLASLRDDVDFLAIAGEADAGREGA
jgi:tetratricopeptide (TPR) repeat protein